MYYEDFLEHIGTKYHSGRYPWGSGGHGQKDLLGELQEMKDQGLSEKQRADAMGWSISKLRSEVTLANNEKRARIADWIQNNAEKLKSEGWTDQRIGEELGISASSVRNYMKFKEDVKINQITNITNALKTDIDKFEYLDVGVGVERQLGISKQKLKAAVEALKEQGYYEHDIYVRRLSDPDKFTTVRVITKQSDLEVVKKNSDKIRTPEVWTDDHGITMQGLKPVQNMDWSRVEIRYKEDGGELKDGVIGLRPNVSDLDMGNAKYAQVRIAVSGTHYMKGMAVYEPDLPKGKDAIFYTNKPKGTPKEKVLKELKDNPDNPFGATIKRQNKLLNIVNEEGDWNNWSATLSSQFLSKQDVSFVKERIQVTYQSILDEFNELKSITNPVVKEHLLAVFGESLVSKAKHLKLAGVPGTKGHVILPITDMSPKEVYAPGYQNGERVVLIRYPHGGKFELPDLVVNNKNNTAKKILGNAQDAIGIHPSVANKLSGADFDGDTVYVVPNSSGKIKTSRSLPELKNFDPQSYKVPHDTIKDDFTQQLEMGKVSNLITDMTIKGASQNEIARAVKHSMVVIDAKKHKLDYKQSAIDNGISALQKKYQLKESGHVGASTLISRAKQDVVVDSYTTVGGKQKVVKKGLIESLDDVRTISSGSKMENAYADYANTLKKLGKEVEKELGSIKPPVRLPSATKEYLPQVKSLDDKLDRALLNAPRERQAQLLASNTYYKNVKPDMSKEEKKKLKAQALSAARVKTGANKELVQITPVEWEAIQNGAISKTKLKQILLNTDIDKVRELATPRESKPQPRKVVTKMRMLQEKGYTYAEISQATGLPVAQVKKLLNVD